MIEQPVFSVLQMQNANCKFHITPIKFQITPIVMVSNYRAISFIGVFYRRNILVGRELQRHLVWRLSLGPVTEVTELPLNIALLSNVFVKIGKIK